MDSEFRRNLQLDSRRLFQLGKHTSSHSKGQVYWKFGTGSKETLDRPDLRSRLIEWYESHYSSSEMRLVVLSSRELRFSHSLEWQYLLSMMTDSLDELESFVSQHYSAIPNLNSIAPHRTYPIPLQKEELSQEIHYRLIKDSPSLRIEFDFPDQSSNWRTKPSSFISHHIGHEGVGSILSLLKKEGLATSL